MSVCVCLEPVLEFLFTSLQQRVLATAAADALQCVCSQCPDQMTAHFDSLVSCVSVCLSVCLCDCLSVCLEPVLEFLFTSLQQRVLATAAADALQCVCSQCPDQMTAHFDSLVRIVTDVDSFDVSNDAAIGLLKGSSLVATSCVCFYLLSSSFFGSDSLTLKVAVKRCFCVCVMDSR